MKFFKTNRLKAYMLVSIACVLTLNGAAVTYNLGDRLGDNLASYCHARWLAYKYDIPFHYTPFKFSEYLAFSKMHPKRDDQSFKSIIRFPQRGKHITIESLNIKRESDTLYVVPFFPEAPYDAIAFGFNYFDIDWNDQKFLSILREEIKPLISFPALSLPVDKITVAVHLRKGSGPDGTIYKLEKFPLRFLPDSFFIEQTKKLSQLFNDQPMYVYIFTDNKNPKALVEKCEKAINKPNIMYTCCHASHPDRSLHELEDFFNLTLFDCMIRPQSHYSQMASHLSHAKVVIYPTTDISTLKKKSKKKKTHVIRPVIVNR